MKTERDTKIVASHTGGAFPMLAPVTLVIESGPCPFRLQDYLTVGEARTLSHALLTVAADVEERQNAAMDDARAAAEDFHVEDDGGAEELAA